MIFRPPHERSLAHRGVAPDTTQGARRAPSAGLIAPEQPSTLSDLQTRVEHRRRALIAEIVEHKKNSSRAGAAEAIDKAKTRLAELARLVGRVVGDGWAHATPDVRLALDEWLVR